MELKVLNYVPVHDINAAWNRQFAMECLKAGATVAQIVAEWPKVWRIEKNQGRDCLAQIYDSIYADGRKDTKYMMVGHRDFIATIKKNKKKKK